MLAAGRVIAAGLVLVFCAAADVAFAVEKEPVTGGLLAVPGTDPAASRTALPQAAPVPVAAPEPSAVPTAAPSAAPSRAAVAEPETGDDTSWGLVLRGGYFGVPNFIADELFHEHPDVAGTSIGAEIRYYGEGGARAGSGIGLMVESATARADGIWQQHESDSPTVASGEISMLVITLTKYWSLFPSWYVHPYFGLGIGVAHAKGHYQDETELVVADYWIPAVHIPIGLAVELGKRFQLAIEGRFIDGIAIGGALQVRF